jgi:hypothetical protein
VLERLRQHDFAQRGEVAFRPEARAVHADHLALGEVTAKQQVRGLVGVGEMHLRIQHHNAVVRVFHQGFEGGVVFRQLRLARPRLNQFLHQFGLRFLAHTLPLKK